MQAIEAAAATVRQPVLRGHQAVAAVWFPAAWFDEQTRAARLIACWRPGASALRFTQGDLLQYATPIDMDCSDLPGWPLRAEGRAFCSAPLSDRERATVPDGDVWIVLGGDVLALHRRDASPIDPEAWLTIDHLSLHDTYDCRIPPPAPVVLDLESRPLREVLGNSVPPASRERGAFLEALQRARGKHPQGVSQPQPRHVPGVDAPRFIAGAAIVIVGLGIILLIAASDVPVGGFPFVLLAAVLIRLLFTGALSRPVAVPGRTVQPVASQGALRQRAQPARPQRWRRWLTRIAMTSRLASVVGRAQARHLRRVLGFFDEGNLAEALRHAIPLDGDRGSMGQAFGTPGRRADLGLSPTYGPATSIDLGDELQNHLRTLYRQAFAKLDREQRIDEAVFVLAELLNAKREALDYLERHRRFAQAAELALGWDMPPDVIVRLHCLANDWRRAVAVARRDNAFATAVVQLEQRWPDVARRLREEWGNALIQQGDWVRAVEVVWPVESLRTQAKQWLLTAESAGGRLGARALVQRAVLLPDTMDRYAQNLLDLQRDRALWRERSAMAEALMGIGRHAATQRLAALIAPSVLADHAQGQRRFNKSELQQLVQLTGDLLLQVDLPNQDWPAAESQPAWQRAGVLCLEAPEAGTQAIFDAVPLDDQCHLLALGEAGACVVDARGRVRTRFATPAHRVVLANSKQVTLLLARRESQWRVSRLDLAQKAIVDLGVLAFDYWATQFDGLSWTVAQGRRLRVLDTHGSLSQVVWQVTDLPGNVCALTASDTVEQILLAVEGKPPQLWTYRLPQRQLVARDEVPLASDEATAVLKPSGGMLRISVEQSADSQFVLRWQASARKPEFRLSMEPRAEIRFWVAGDWFVVGTSGAAGHLFRWLLLESGTECVRVQWPADSVPDVRVFRAEWLVFDARGRLLCVNPNTSQHQSVVVR
jgi:hypothetical protein